METAFQEQVAVEKILFGDSPVFRYIEIQRKDFLLHLFVMFPKLRPHHIDNFSIFCSHYLHEESFRKNVLKRVFVVCPTLIQRLYQTKCFTKNEIRESLLFHQNMFLYLFFKKEIELDGFNFVHNQYSKEYWNEKELASLIQFGFLKSSIEFCLKYDRYEEMESMMANNPGIKECKWSPFEWSVEPKSLDFLSFSGIFGSLKCFRVLLLSGFVLNEQHGFEVASSGSLEQFKLVSDHLIICSTFLHEASKFFHLSVVEYLVNQKADINAKDEYEDF